MERSLLGKMMDDGLKSHEVEPASTVHVAMQNIEKEIGEGEVITIADLAGYFCRRRIAMDVSDHKSFYPILDRLEKYGGIKQIDRRNFLLLEH